MFTHTSALANVYLLGSNTVFLIYLVFLNQIPKNPWENNRFFFPMAVFMAMISDGLVVLLPKKVICSREPKLGMVWWGSSNRTRQTWLLLQSLSIRKEPTSWISPNHSSTRDSPSWLRKLVFCGLYQSGTPRAFFRVSSCITHYRSWVLVGHWILDIPIY